MGIVHRKVSRKKQGGGVGWFSFLTPSSFLLFLPLRSPFLATLHHLKTMGNSCESPFLLNNHDYFFYLNPFTPGNFANQRKGRWVVGHGNFQGNVYWFFAFFYGVLDWIVLNLVWFERSLHSAQVSGQSCPWTSKLMTSQAVIIIIIIIIIIVYWYPSRSLKAELQGRSVTLTEDNTMQKQSSR